MSAHEEIMNAHLASSLDGSWDYPKGRTTIKAGLLPGELKKLRTFEVIHQNATHAPNMEEYYVGLCKRCKIY